MFSQAELETILAIGIVLVCLAASVNIYWILNGWPFGKAQDAQIEAIRRTVAKVMRPMVTWYLRAIDER